MILVVAVASPGSPNFAVINFSNTPPTVVMTPGFENGNVVDCYGTLAAVAENSGDSVAIFDISTPASPVKIGTVKTGFQIGSISIDSKYVLTGEFEGSRVSLIDISNPASPAIVSVSDCAPALNIITNVALRSPTAVVAGDNNSLALYFANPSVGAVPIPILQNATGPSDYDGSTAAIATSGLITTYALSGNAATKPATISFGEGPGSVAVAEIPSGGYLVAAGGLGSFTVFAYPSTGEQGSLVTSLQKGTSSTGTIVKFLNNPAIAPFLAVANVSASGVSVFQYMIQATGLPSTQVSFFTPIPEAKVALAAGYVPTLGITAFTPKRRLPFPLPGWLEKMLHIFGL